MWAIFPGVACLTLQPHISWISKSLARAIQPSPRWPWREALMLAYLDSCPSRQELWIYGRQGLRKRRTKSFFLLCVFSTSQKSQSPSEWATFHKRLSTAFYDRVSTQWWGYTKDLQKWNLHLAYLQERYNVDTTVCSKSETTTLYMSVLGMKKISEIKMSKGKYKVLGHVIEHMKQNTTFPGSQKWLKRVIKGEPHFLHLWKPRITEKARRLMHLKSGETAWNGWLGIISWKDRKIKERAGLWRAEEIKRVFRAVLEL